MPESPIVVSLKEFTELLIRERNVHSGDWAPYFRFGLNVANINVEYPEGVTNMRPASLVSLLELGIQQFPEPTPMTLDAGKVNPKPKPNRPKKGGKRSLTKSRK